MTHPEITHTEMFGSLNYSPRQVGECLYCEAVLYDEGEIVESRDGLFCDMDCCLEYYEIRKLY